MSASPAHMRALAALAGSAGMIAAAMSGAPALAQDAPAFQATELSAGITLISGPDGNVVVGEQPDGLVVIDGGSAEHAGALVDFITEETGADTVATLVNTSWRPDHTGLNETLGAQGTEIVAHANTHQWMKYGTDNRADGETYAPAPDAALPTNVLYDDGGVLPFGEDEIRLGYLLQAHTDSDLYAYFPGANVLVTGETVRADGWTMLDWWTGGYIGGLLDGYLELLEVADEDTVIVPVSGPVMSKADLQAQFEMYEELYDRLATLLKDSRSPEEAVDADPTEGFHPEWEGEDRFVDLAMRSYFAHLRGDPRLGAIP